MILASLNTNSGGKHRNATNRSLIERRILWRHISKIRTQNFFKFRILNPIRPGGAQRPGWPNSQLPIRNLLSYDAQTWWLLVFILKTPFGHILAKLVNQEGCCCSFLIETSQKFWKWKIFLFLKIVEIDMGGQFWVEKNDSGHKNSFF